jgi:hypothetical protein
MVYSLYTECDTLPSLFIMHSWYLLEKVTCYLQSIMRQIHVLLFADFQVLERLHRGPEVSHNYLHHNYPITTEK